MVTRVYVANYAGHDYSTALRQYGELHPVIMGFIPFENLDRVKYRVAEALRDSWEEDWLILSGANIINVLAALIMFIKHRKVKILNFDKTTGIYRECIIKEEAELLLLTTLGRTK